MASKMIEIEPKCPFCGKKQKISVPRDGFRAYMNGALVQDAFPTLDASTRELIMTGICDDCFPSEPDFDDEEV